MTVLDIGVVASGGCEGCACAGCDRDDDAEPPRIAGFDTAISMAEAAGCGNVTWWNTIRAHADDPSVGEYAASVLLARLIRSSAHRLGIPAADVWTAIRRSGRLPL
ncbi:hypothetical protein [Gordonia insulae]|uniref:Uncharacterized protein n=1 Tax=Gordonia insulae TaxID=2420509 RepID=A0A3G8JIN3_9ACTN|nr:hypothetical protein [Gordonia insulae]AZG44080.1 hypothetical protein D7316_00660 [Gordonia insulae]